MSYSITKPTGYEDGTAFGTEQLVYIVYSVSDDKQLFSTFNLAGMRTDIPDGVTCIYARAGVYDLTNNRVLIGPDGKSTLSDKSPSSCKATPPPPPSATKRVAVPGIKWN
jgi:hypothetical protein